MITKRKIHAQICVAIVATVLAIGLALFDSWLPRMLLCHYKFAVNPNPPQLEELEHRREDVQIETEDGVPIKGWLVMPKQDQVGTTVIVLHTLGRTREDMLDFALPLLSEGFDLLFIDLRGHGESGGKFFTYGANETADVAAAVDFLESRSDCGKRIAVLGASAGGAVAICTASQEERISSVVSIAAYADLERIVEHQASWLPGFWRRRAMRNAEKLASFAIADASPATAISNLSCPVLIVHGDQDDYVPYADAQALYDAAPSGKELYTIPGANHATMFSKGGKGLLKKIAEFLKEGPDRGSPETD